MSSPVTGSLWVPALSAILRTCANDMGGERGGRVCLRRRAEDRKEIRVCIHLDHFNFSQLLNSSHGPQKACRVSSFDDSACPTNMLCVTLR